MSEDSDRFDRAPLSRAVWTKDKSPGRFPGDLLELSAVLLIGVVLGFFINYDANRDDRHPQCPCCCLRSGVADDRQ